MQEAVATLSPSGASRIEDWIWPSRMQAAQGPFNDLQCSARNGAVSVTGVTAGVGAGGLNRATLYLGVPCFSTVCTAVDATHWLFYAPMALFFATSRVAMNPPENDRAVYRIIWTFAGSGLAPNAGIDFGLEFTRIVGTLGRILIDVADGFGFRLNGTTLEWIVRGPNGLKTVNIATAAGGFDITQWHTLDMRIRGATATADATLELLLDGTAVNLGAANSSWAAGTNLPPEALVGVNVGFRPNIFAAAGNANSINVYQLRRICAPTVAATL